MEAGKLQLYCGVKRMNASNPRTVLDQTLTPLSSYGFFANGNLTFAGIVVPEGEIGRG